LGDNGLPTGRFVLLPADALIPPHGFLLIFRRQSHLALPNAAGDLHLAQPIDDGWRIADSFIWERSPGYDRSFSRLPDGFGAWDVRAVTPGQPNAPLPTPPPPPPATPVPPTPAPAFGPPQPIANAYLAPPKTYITLIGAVTVAPGDFSRRLLYIQDDSGGIMVYLWRGEYPALHVGDQVQVQGRLKDYHGQRELVLRNASALTLLGKGPQPQPQFVRTGQVTDGLMGRLLLVAGRVRNVRKYSFELDDGSGPVRIEHPYKAPWQLPALQPGMTVSVMGVVARYKDSLHILPRSPQDISPPPGVLPTTGGKN
jgi:DNA/RNA endonuclease YhcR with UshA esterase domain